MVTITEAKNGLSALIDVVQAGEAVLIVDRGRPVARLDTAVSVAADDPEGRLARLQRAGIVRTSLGAPAEQGSAQPRPRKGASAVEALIEERHAGR